jgi:MFS family permease
VAKHSLGGASAWAIIVTGEGIGSLLGGLAGLRFMPRRPMLVIGALFVVTSLQCALLALEAPPAAIGCAALLAGFAFSYGTVVWDTTLQSTIARDKLSRVSAYNWMGAMIFLPAGYAIAGPVADVIGISTSLWIGTAWIVLSTIAVLCVPGVRNVRSSVQPRESELAPLEEAVGLEA